MAYFMITLSNWLGRIPANNHPWQDILYDNATSKYNGTLAYCDTRHYHSIRENKYVITNRYRFTFCLKLRIIQIMTQRVDFCVMCYPDIVSDSNSTSIIKIAAKVNRRIFTYSKLPNMEELASPVNISTPLT
jgi:hypothetical protein